MAMSKLFLLFCYIFGCHAGTTTDLIRPILMTEEIETCPGFGRFPNQEDITCESYILCVKNENDELVSEVLQCPNGTAFNVARSRCTKKQPNFICPHICKKEEGKLPYRQIDCQHYIQCERGESSEFVATLEKCPNGTWFCGEVRDCITGPSNACLSNATTTPSSNLTTEGMTTFSPLPTLPPINSTEHPTNETTWETTTSGGISTENNTFSTFETTTSSTSEPIYNGTSTEPTSTTTTTTDSDDDDFHFTCNKIGRYPLPGICNQYILCVQGESGEWIMSLEKCPKGAVFSTKRARCVVV